MPADKVPPIAGFPIAVDVQRIAPVAWLPADEEFQRWVAAACRAVQPPERQAPEPGAMTIRLVDLEEGTALNTQWRHKAGPTNVLAFPGPPMHGGTAPVEYGDLVICVPVVIGEALEQQKDPASHLAHLVVHGTLHLLGYTHEAEADAERMESLETRILAGFDIADPYVSTGKSR